MRDQTAGTIGHPLLPFPACFRPSALGGLSCPRGSPASFSALQQHPAAPGMPKTESLPGCSLSTPRGLGYGSRQPEAHLADMESRGYLLHLLGYCSQQPEAHPGGVESRGNLLHLPAQSTRALVGSWVSDATGCRPRAKGRKEEGSRWFLRGRSEVLHLVTAEKAGPTQ